MRVALALAAVAILSQSAHAKNCARSSPDIVELVSWEAEAAEHDGAVVKMVVRNVAPRTIEMVDATVWFTDVLGASIGGASVDRDIKLGNYPLDTSTVRAL